VGGRGDDRFNILCRHFLSDVEDFYSNDKFSEVANPFSNAFLLFFEKLSSTFLPLKAFRWTLLKNPLVWEESQHSSKYIADADQIIMNILNEYELFNDFSHITNIRRKWVTGILI
jgi:hypothetical protein